ncbi:hypothetical protein SCOR_02715 [Sulfidibacter corallicola]|uniref:Uncharacterized protein n=1 Tax=Sulfidibacter corallicola TaxID=2818388 RepID=A0A8A4TIE9_SULCO|nr:hypothetical protein [Sulfidibacter corallicola]QTD48558.1 hypothetical protein J3U87_23505 [Sulfidibacter corallicola]
MNIYQEWGFTESPFQTKALEADEKGEALLVGRNSEIIKIQRRLHNPPKITSIEGANGIGKTSLINVAAYKCFKSFLESGNSPVIIPLNKNFQLNPSSFVEEFVNDVLMEVAQALIEHQSQLKKITGNLDTRHLNSWLNSPQIHSYSASISGLFGGGKINAINTSSGFSRSGFKKIVLDWLSELFPSHSSGGVLCVVDNLELLMTSNKAREFVEQLRDEILLSPGLRWVVCGALGVTYSVLSSPRIEGILHDPINIKKIDDECIEELWKSRIEYYAVISEPYMPLTIDSFRLLYEILNGNTRSVLSYSDNYCTWVSDNDQPQTKEEKEEYFQEWLDFESSKIFSSVSSFLRPRAWSVFDKLIELGGETSPGSFAEFGFRSYPAMRPSIKDLEDCGLVTSLQDDSDKRKKTILVTPKARLVHYHKHISNTQE